MDPAFPVHGVCSLCRGKTGNPGPAQLICGACAYCSEGCRSDDLESHSKRCFKIGMVAGEVRRRAAALRQDGVLLYRELGYASTRRQVADYFTARQLLMLIEALVREGCRDLPRLRWPHCNEGGEMNRSAIETAILHCHHILILNGVDTFTPSKDARMQKYLMSICLFTGRLQELYDASCYLAQRGRLGANSSIDQPEADHYLSSFSSKERLPRRNVKVSHDDCKAPMKWAAAAYMYLAKYLLHIKVDNLMLINAHFLDNSDCLKWIGE